MISLKSPSKFSCPRPAHTHSRGSQATRKCLKTEKLGITQSVLSPKSPVIHYRSFTVVKSSPPTQIPPEYTADNQQSICGASDCISLILPFSQEFFFFWRIFSFLDFLFKDFFSFHQHVLCHVLYINPSTLRHCSNIQNFSFLWSL